MRFVIIHARSRQRSHRTPGQFLSRRCFTLCITVKVEPRIAKQYKCQYCCSCKKYRGKGMEGGQKVCGVIFWLTRRSRVRRKNAFWGIVLHEQQVIAYCQTHYDYGLQKCLQSWQCKIHCHCLPLWRKYAPEVKTAKGLKRWRVKSRELTTPPESPNSYNSTFTHPGTWLDAYCSAYSHKVWTLSTQHSKYAGFYTTLGLGHVFVGAHHTVTILTRNVTSSPSQRSTKQICRVPVKIV